MNWFLCQFYADIRASLIAQSVKSLPAMQETHSWVGKIPWRSKWQHTPVFLPGESHGQRSLEGYSPWGLKESDTTERLITQHIIYISSILYFSLRTNVWNCNFHYKLMLCRRILQKLVKLWNLNFFYSNYCETQLSSLRCFYSNYWTMCSQYSLM